MDVKKQVYINCDPIPKYNSFHKIGSLSYLFKIYQDHINDYLSLFFYYYNLK